MQRPLEEQEELYAWITKEHLNEINEADLVELIILAENASKLILSNFGLGENVLSHPEFSSVLKLTSLKSKLLLPLKLGDQIFLKPGIKITNCSSLLVEVSILKNATREEAVRVAFHWGLVSLRTGKPKFFPAAFNGAVEAYNKNSANSS